MAIAWDQLAVYLIVVAAAVYLARGWFGRRRSGCGGCNSCGDKPEAPEPQPLVQIEIPTPERKRSR